VAISYQRLKQDIDAVCVQRRTDTANQDRVFPAIADLTNRADISIMSVVNHGAYHRQLFPFQIDSLQ